MNSKTFQNKLNLRGCQDCPIRNDNSTKENCCSLPSGIYESLKTDEEKDIFLKDFANACDEMMKNPACDTDDDYKAIAEQVKMFR